MRGSKRRLPIGAEVTLEGVHFRVWAPRRRRVALVLEGGPGATNRELPLIAEEGGYHSRFVPEARAGTRYRLRLDDVDYLYPDPASRFQPDGPHGASEVVDPSSFRWTDHEWRGVAREGQVLYEMHVGTFTREGTYDAALRELPALADLGVTTLELMPVAEFPGRFGWGYDGVDLFAPTRLYGRPDELRRFVDRAHSLGLGVILDVVYNHLGPDGNYLAQFSETYFTKRYSNEWGEPINFDGPGAGPVREFFVSNAGYWIDEFHFDGLRLDATQSMFDASREHVCAELVRRVREAARGRRTLVVAENEPQAAWILRAPEEGGWGVDAVWNDDFHHSARVALTGRREAYYLDYRGSPQELVSAAKRGYLFQGQRYAWQKKRRGSPVGAAPASAFVCFLQNHDQVANSLRGERLHEQTSPSKHRAMTALLLLQPATPFLFQGQEFSASSPFLYFADHHPELARLVRAGRGDFLKQFPSIASESAAACLPDPSDAATFGRCRLDHAERDRHAQAWALHLDLLRLRRQDPVFRAQDRLALDGAVLADDAFVLRWFGDRGDDRLLVVNLGRAIALDVAPEPLLAPPERRRWRMRFTSEDVRYGGGGCAPPETEDEGWKLPAESAIVLVPEDLEEE